MTITHIPLPLSFEEAKLFLAGLSAEETLGLPLTKRNLELIEMVHRDDKFRQLVRKACDKFVSDGVLALPLEKRLMARLGLDTL